jgi:hypothetical protein
VLRPMEPVDPRMAMRFMFEVIFSCSYFVSAGA